VEKKCTKIKLNVKIAIYLYLSDGPLDHGSTSEGGAVHLLVVEVLVTQVLVLHLVPNRVPEHSTTNVGQN